MTLVSPFFFNSSPLADLHLFFFHPPETFFSEYLTIIRITVNIVITSKLHQNSIIGTLEGKVEIFGSSGEQPASARRETKAAHSLGLKWVNLHLSLHIYDVTRCQIQSASADKVSRSWWLMCLWKPPPAGAGFCTYLCVFWFELAKKSRNEADLKPLRLRNGKLYPTSTSESLRSAEESLALPLFIVSNLSSGCCAWWQILIWVAQSHAARDALLNIMMFPLMSVQIDWWWLLLTVAAVLFRGHYPAANLSKWCEGNGGVSTFVIVSSSDAHSHSLLFRG